MAKRKLIAGLLSVLLIVFFNNNLPFELANAKPDAATVSFLGSQHAEHNYLVHITPFGRHNIIKEHIKVRYKGSECSYCSVPSNFARKEFLPVKAFQCSPHSSLVLSSDQFHFKLRGPPCSISAGMA